MRILRRPDGTVVTADCWARLRAARRRGFLPFLGMMVLVAFTELIAIGVGLGRLKGLVRGAAPPRHQRADGHSCVAEAERDDCADTSAGSAQAAAAQDG